MTAGLNLSPSGALQCQSSKNGTGKRLARRWEDDLNIYLQPDKSNRDNNDLTSDMTWLTAAEDSSKWDAMESYFISSRLKQPARPTTAATQPTKHGQTTRTTKAQCVCKDLA